MTWTCFRVWFSARSRPTRLLFHLLWSAEAAVFTLILCAPRAAAQGVNSFMGFTGVQDSFGVPTSANMSIQADSSLISWDGVLPKFGGTANLANGIYNVLDATQTTLITVTGAAGLWLIRTLRAEVWDDIFGSIFKAVGFSLDQVINSAPFLGIGLSAGIFAGAMLIGFGRGAAGRATMGLTLGIGFLGLLFGNNVISRLLAPQGWLSDVRVVSEGAASTIMRKGHEIGSGQTAVDGHFQRIETGMADFIRQSLQQWMLGRVVDPATAPGPDSPPPPEHSDLACSSAWTRGQLSGDPAALAKQIGDHCPADVLARVQDPQPTQGFFLWILLIACIFVAVVFAWRGLSSLFKAVATAGFAPLTFIYALFPGFPRRFGKMVATDFVVQLGKYGMYNVLTGIYVLILGVCLSLPYKQFHADFLVAKLAITAIIMLFFNTFINHMADLHRQALGQGHGADPSAGKIMRPVAAAAGGAAAMGLAATSAARGGGAARGTGGAGQPVSNRATSGRINAGLQAAQMALGRSHPAAAAVGAMAGGFGSAGYSALAKRGAAREEARAAGQSTSGGGSGAGSGPRKRGAAAGTTPSAAARRAAQVNQDAAAIARAASAERPNTPAAGTKPVDRPPGGPAV